MNACGDSRLRGLRSRKPIGFRQWVVHLDYRIQKEKESPMLLPSRARVLYDAAKELVRKEQKPTSLMEMIAPVDKKELKLALLNAYGVSWEELKEMDHYDLDDSELDG